jgi:hypothetical protein
MRFLNFFLLLRFVDHFCLPGSGSGFEYGSGSTDLIESGSSMDQDPQHWWLVKNKMIQTWSCWWTSLPATPSIRGMLGPHRSISSTPTRSPAYIRKTRNKNLRKELNFIPRVFQHSNLYGTYDFQKNCIKINNWLNFQSFAL